MNLPGQFPKSRNAGSFPARLPVAAPFAIFVEMALKSIRKRLIPLAIASLVTPGAVMAEDVQPLSPEPPPLGFRPTPFRLREGVIAKVNNRVVTVGDVFDELTQERIPLLGRSPGGFRREDDLLREAREAAIERALIIEEAARLNVAAPDDAVENQIAEVVRRRFDNDRLKLFEDLARMGLTLDEWRTRLKEDYVVQSMQRLNVEKGVSLSPGQLLRAYEERRSEWNVPARVQIRLITIRFSDDSPRAKEQALEKARKAKERLATGEPFDAVAREVSQDSKARAGGDWGWRNLTDFAAPLPEALERLPLGEVSEPIATPDAIYLALVEAREPARTIPFEEVRPRLEEELRKAETRRAYRRWIERLKTRHAIQLFDDI